MKKLVTALILIFATAVWAGDFEDGVAASNKGDYKTAISFYKKAAEQGGSAAQYNLGLMYGNGKGVLQDWTSHGAVDKLEPQIEARSNASGLTPPRWLWRRVRL
jgi:TPR repeat protein